MILRFPLAILLLNTLNLVGQSPSRAAESPAARGPQRYVCNVGYTPEQCDAQMAVLRRVVGRYPAVERLGAWTWVLVKSQDWKRLKSQLELDVNSPAFSSLERRQTFVEEALVTPVPGRSADLIRHWEMSIDDLLVLAVTHEIGHGSCGDNDEHRADTYGKLLRSHMEVTCTK